MLVVMQWRKRHFEQEVKVDEHGREVVHLKGPWQVRFPFRSPPHSLFFILQLCACYLYYIMLILYFYVM